MQGMRGDRAKGGSRLTAGSAAQIAIRKMLRDDNSNAVMLLFGYIGLLNAVCLAPVLLILHFSGVVRLAGLTARVIGLTVCKGGASKESKPTTGRPGMKIGDEDGQRLYCIRCS